MAYFTDDEYLAFLGSRIERLKATLARAEALGLKGSSNVGLSKSYADSKEVEKQLYRTLAEYKAVKARMDGTPINPTIKKVTVE